MAEEEKKNKGIHVVLKYQEYTVQGVQINPRDGVIEIWGWEGDRKVCVAAFPSDKVKGVYFEDRTKAGKSSSGGGAFAVGH